MAGELGKITGCTLSGSKCLETAERIRSHRGSTGQILVGQGGDLTVVGQTFLPEAELSDLGSRRGSEERADVDGHVEQRESRVPLRRVLGVVVEVADHHLQVALEQAGTHRDEEQGAEHGYLAHYVSSGRNRQAEIAREHNDDTGNNHLAVAELVGEDTSDERHEIYCRQEASVDIGGHCLREAELRLQEQGEDRKHRVIAKALARVGKGERIQAFGLTFEHISLF